ncbi:ABC transporter permease [Psychrobacillus glaciei]|uniref:ABC transporter permease n=2 Tax=Psychrobacillus glaciei TaxID=2283160 RepID=A0A5J6ST93_9BACI|nr:ABC transporter permease subunit [Psychrobacillus glaciei]QFG00780.1 ABC transporter permease [Psychrobacillus glaciei]
MSAYFKMEFFQFMSNKKNIAIYVILLFFSCYYALKIAPEYDPIEKVDVSEIEARYLTREKFLKRVVIDQWTHQYTRFAAGIYPEWNKYDKGRLDAIKQHKLNDYAEATFKWYMYSDEMIYRYGGETLFYNPRYYTYGNTYSWMDGHYAYLYSASRFEGYTEGKSNLSVNVFEERTALQTLQRLLQAYLPLILLVCCILFTVDIVMKDRRNPTLLQGLPFSDWGKLLVKGVVSLLGSILAIIPLSVGLLIIGARNGFGDLWLPVPIIKPGEKYFSNIMMWQYLMENMIFIMFWFLFIVSLLLLVSVILKNEFANLVVGCVFVVAEFMYYVRGIGAIRDVQWYPTSYVQVGQIISGYRNFLYVTDGLTFGTGLFIIGLCTCIFLFVTFLISRHRKFKLF